jgi:radical SAM superfamily enzyme YgiQ (UPF0313 family)
MSANIILTTINAKWIHPSLALRLLKANLGALEDNCEIIELNLRQPLAEKLEGLLAALTPDDDLRILGISVSIWNHAATIELLENFLAETQRRRGEEEKKEKRPVIVLGGPEVSHLPPDSKIFNFADYVICGEGETAFRLLCEKILQNEGSVRSGKKPGEKHFEKFINAAPVNLNEIKTAYHLYTDEDITKKLIYVEASRGCIFNCEFCLSAADSKVREFTLEQFLNEMEELIRRGVKTFKFLDRSININVKRTIQVCNFFIDRINQLSSSPMPFVVHFEMVPSIFPPELLEALARFPPGTLRLEIGIQTLNPKVAALICRSSNPQKELDALRFLCDKTNAIIHADLIAGLPGEDLTSFGKGFDNVWLALGDTYSNKLPAVEHSRIEIQLGILKLLPGAPICRRNEEFLMRYNSQPPYEVLETSAMSAGDVQRIKNFARFWELIVNRGLAAAVVKEKLLFVNFMCLSDYLFAYFGRNWGIDKNELMEAIEKYWRG